MTQFVSDFTKEVTGLGHDVEDANPTPLIFRTNPNPRTAIPLSQHPEAGRSKNVTGSPYYDENNPLPV